MRIWKSRGGPAQGSELRDVLDVVAAEPTAAHRYARLRGFARDERSALRVLAALDAVLSDGEPSPAARFARGDLLLRARRYEDAFESYRLGSWQHATDSRPDLFAGLGPESPRRLPDFLILGAMKCGTTSLFRLLGTHPRVLGTVRKELHYWDAPTLGAERPYRRADYACLLPPAAGGDAFVVGDGTPSTLREPVAEHVARELPRAKFIVALRDPADRAVSEYHHAVRAGRERRSLDEVLHSGVVELRGIEALPPDAAWKRMMELRARHSGGRRNYLWKGLYDVQLAQWLSIVPRERFLFVDFRSLVEQPTSVAAEAYRFLGLPEEAPPTPMRLNVASYDRAQAAADLDPVRELFEPHVRRTRELTGLGLAG